MADALERLMSPMRAAIEQYQMIKHDDSIAVGLSGGKDSMVLLALLVRLKRFYPSPFTLSAITLDPCFGGCPTDYTPITELCAEWGIPHLIKKTRLSEIVFDERNESNPCSLCARMRRGALHKIAKESGCNVVALGHHQDDAAETLLMNLFSGGTIGCFSPVSDLTRRQLRLIRPLIFISQDDILTAARKCSLPLIKSGCPIDGITHRQDMRKLISELSGRYGNLNGRLTGALQKGNISGW